MLYCSLDMACNGFNYSFTSLTAQKNKILKKWKKYLEISSFYICVPKIMIRWCTVPEIWCMTDIIVISHFGLFFALLPPNSPKKQNFEKIKKKCVEISSFYICVPKIMIRWCTVPEICCVTEGWRDGQTKRTDGRKKWHIELGVPPKKE